MFEEDEEDRALDAQLKQNFNALSQAAATGHFSHIGSTMKLLLSSTESSSTPEASQRDIDDGSQDIDCEASLSLPVPSAKKEPRFVTEDKDVAHVLKIKRVAWTMGKIVESRELLRRVVEDFESHCARWEGLPPQLVSTCIVAWIDDWRARRLCAEMYLDESMSKLVDFEKSRDIARISSIKSSIKDQEYAFFCRRMDDRSYFGKIKMAVNEYCASLIDRVSTIAIGLPFLRAMVPEEVHMTPAAPDKNNASRVAEYIARLKAWRDDGSCGALPSMGSVRMGNDMLLDSILGSLRIPQLKQTSIARQHADASLYFEKQWREGEIQMMQVEDTDARVFTADRTLPRRRTLPPQVPERRWAFVCSAEVRARETVIWCESSQCFMPSKSAV